MLIYLKLFFEFLKAGFFAVGGGLATLPFLFDISEKTGWFSTQDIMNMIAVSESTPGPLGVNMATFAGTVTVGVAGGLVATLGLIFPSIVVVEIIAKVLEKFKSAKIVQAIFMGLRPASTALIAVAAITVAKNTLLNIEAFTQTSNVLELFEWVSIVMAGALFVIMKKWKKHPVIYIVMAAVIGIVIGL